MYCYFSEGHWGDLLLDPLVDHGVADHDDEGGQEILDHETTVDIHQVEVGRPALVKIQVSQD